jgi:hypothetical protein
MFATTLGQEADLPQGFKGPYMSYWRTVEVYPSLTWFIASFRLPLEAQSRLRVNSTRLFESEIELIQHIRMGSEERMHCLHRVVTFDGGTTWRIQQLTELWLPGEQPFSNILLHAIRGDSALYDETDVMVDRKCLKGAELIWREGP